VQSARDLKRVASVLIQRYLQIRLVGLAMCSELYHRLQSFFLLHPLHALDGRLHVLFLDVSFELPLTCGLRDGAYIFLNNLSFLSSPQNEIMYRPAGIIYLDGFRSFRSARHLSRAIYGRCNFLFPICLYLRCPPLISRNGHFSHCCLMLLAF